MKKALLTFVGAQDPINKRGIDGPVLTLLEHLRFDAIHLLYTVDDRRAGVFFGKNALDLQNSIQKKYLDTSVFSHLFDCRNPVDHNDVYLHLMEFCHTLPREGLRYTAAIASGTPTMQACWILLAESGDFPVTLVRANDPTYIGPRISVVKLGAFLPRVHRLEKERKAQKKKYEDLLPTLTIDTSAPSVAIGETEVTLSPILFGCYLFFAVRAHRGLGAEKIQPTGTTHAVLKEMLDYCVTSYPDARDSLTEKMKRAVRANEGMKIETLRSYISRINNAIQRATSRGLAEEYSIRADRRRISKKYGAIGYHISAPPRKIVIRPEIKRS